MEIRIKRFIVFFSVFVLFGMSVTVHAALDLIVDVDVPESCSANDTDGAVHDYPSSSSYLAICALQAAIETGSITSAQLSNQFPSMGLFVTAFNDVVADPNSQYWAIFQNGDFANSGITLLPVIAGDALMFQLQDFSGANLGDQVVLNIHSLVAPVVPVTLSSITITTPANKLSYTVGDVLDISSLVVTGTYSDTSTKVETITGTNVSGFDSSAPATGQILTITVGSQTTTYLVDIIAAPTGGASGSRVTPISPTFDVFNALNYLKNVQSTDGSFSDSGLYTDWVAVAYGAMDVAGSSRNSLLEYILANNSVSSSLTENERRAMALLSLKQNPYSFDGKDYISNIVGSFDGTQFGDASLVNDDIFALIPLASAGFTASDDIIAKDISFILGKQHSNGSWESSIDLTAAAIQALENFKSTNNVSSALEKASVYLQNAQSSDGGWGNVSSSSWVAQAMNALNESWSKDGKTFTDYFATEQMADGGMLANTETLPNRIWATAYAVTAASGKSWSDIMESVSKPTIKTTSNLETTTDVLVVEPIIEKAEVQETEQEIEITKPKVVVNKKINKVVATTPKIISETITPEAIQLVANVAGSKNKVPTPVILGGIVILGGLIIFQFRKFIF